MKRLVVVVVALAAALGGALALRKAVATDEDPVVIVHWSNSHPMRDGLLPDMAADFNDENHETSSGRPIEIQVVKCDSSVQVGDLVARSKGTGQADDSCEDTDGNRAGDPTIVTPQSADWLIDVNEKAGREVVDREGAQNIAETWLGIVTYREMAECLGWPDRQLGYQDIIELKANPEGWGAHDCARAEWGREPLLAFTNPSTSTSGRNVLISLYAIAAGKDPADLTVADIEQPEVVEYVKQFQTLVNHYMPGTIPLNTKIAQGPEYGHFFLMPEDNLVSLINGNEEAIATDGTETTITEVGDLVMLYPKEGSVLNSNPAGIVDASWVTPDHVEGATEWIDFLREDDQQQQFMSAGFRPASGTNLTVDERQFAEWGLAATEPPAKIEPGQLQPAVLSGIRDSWGSVKPPAIVTFVVDVSGSMTGEPLDQVKDGMMLVLDAMEGSDSPGNDNQVGLVTFSDEIVTEIAPAPLAESKYDLADAVKSMEAAGSTALYDAIERAVELTDAAEGDPRATRAVVVLSDGAATAGRCLDDVVTMSSRTERSIRFCGHESDVPIDDRADEVPIGDVFGDDLLVPHRHDVQVFFLGFNDADVNIGRILAKATRAEYQGATDDLATVIEDLSGYF